MVETVLTTIDKDSLQFLYSIYFGRYEQRIDAASNRAYRDMNRTIRFQGLITDKRLQLKKQVTGELDKGIQKIASQQSIDQKLFDAWHRKMCDRIIKIYLKENVILSYGQTQKWINMTLKYLYILGDKSTDKLFSFCHIPIDNYIFEIAKKKFDIPKPKTAWSRWTDYSKQYMNYQKQLRQAITDIAPLRWEFKAWLEEARGIDA